MSVVITARRASDDEIAAEMDRRGTVIEALEAERDRLRALNAELLEALERWAHDLHGTGWIVMAAEMRAAIAKARLAPPTETGE